MRENVEEYRKIDLILNKYADFFSLDILFLTNIDKLLPEDCRIVACEITIVSMPI